MIELLISLILAVTPVSANGTAKTKDSAKKPDSSTTAPVGVGTHGGTSTWGNGTDRS